eukprot:SAG31_NODE_2288_length_6003_cov_1.876355_8_plen_124_part_00
MYVCMVMYGRSKDIAVQVEACANLQAAFVTGSLPRRLCVRFLQPRGLVLRTADAGQVGVCDLKLRLLAHGADQGPCWRGREKRLGCGDGGGGGGGGGGRKRKAKRYLVSRSTNSGQKIENNPL